MASFKPSGATRATILDGGGMTTSFWGIGGSEDLGGGLTAKFALESYIRNDIGAGGRSDTDPLFARSAYVGLVGGFGEIRVGRQPNPFGTTVMFEPTGASTRFSPLLNQLWTPAFGRVVSGDTTRVNGLGYISPTIGGFSTQLVYSLGEVAGTDGTNNISGNLTYRTGGLAVGLAAQRVEFGPGIVAASPNEKDYALGASYDFQVVKAFGQYNKKKTDGVSLESDTYSVGASVPVGVGKILAAVASTKFDATDIRRNTAVVGYDHALSKRTDVYVNYLYDKLSNANVGNTVAVGVRHSF